VTISKELSSYSSTSSSSSSSNEFVSAYSIAPQQQVQQVLDFTKATAEQKQDEITAEQINDENMTTKDSSVNSVVLTDDDCLVLANSCNLIEPTKGTISTNNGIFEMQFAIQQKRDAGSFIVAVETDYKAGLVQGFSMVLFVTKVSNKIANMPIETQTKVYLPCGDVLIQVKENEIPCKVSIKLQTQKSAFASFMQYAISIPAQLNFVVTIKRFNKK